MGVALDLGEEGGWWRQPEMVALPLAKLGLHLASLAVAYGHFRDELYYVACSERLAWGYVDHPPLSIAVLRAWRRVAGDSLVALRLPAIVAGVLTVLLVGLLARRLGADRAGRTLAMTVALLTPSLLSVASYYSMNSLDVLAWTFLAWLLLGLLQSDAGASHRWRWLAVGLVAGLGLLNKLSVLWLVGGLAVGILLTPLRRRLASPWPWAAVALAGLVFLPHVAWQIRHDWPTLEFVANATGLKMAPVPPLDFLAGQVVRLHPVHVPVALAGLAYLLLAQRGILRPLGLAVLAVLALLLASGSSRAGYLAPTYPLLLAAGAVALVEWGRLWKRRWRRWAYAAFLLLVVAGGLLWAPRFLPLLPVETFLRYARALGVEATTEERKEVGALSQHYADRFGWPEIVEQVSAVYRSLPDDERKVAGIFTGNYGEAAALDLMGRGLPPALSGHNNYWLWGPRGFSGEVMVVLVSDADDLREVYDDVQLAGRTSCRYCMPYEDGKPIWIARRPRALLRDGWPQLKHYD